MGQARIIYRPGIPCNLACVSLLGDNRQYIDRARLGFLQPKEAEKR